MQTSWLIQAFSITDCFANLLRSSSDAYPTTDKFVKLSVTLMLEWTNENF